MTSSTGTTADYYGILGIDAESGHEEIRAAYRAKLRLWHPDLAGDETEDVRRAATEMTAQLNEAYECLGDPDRRVAYDTARGSNSEPPRSTSTSQPRRSHGRGRSNHRVRDISTISLGGIVVLLALAGVAGLFPAATPPHPTLIAALSLGVIFATILVLASSRLLRQPDRLAPIGMVWSHLMRWSGWLFIGGLVVVLGIPAIVFILIALVAAPFSGLILIALISGRSVPREG
jgi:curved DNA-binding protein CbpA